MLRYLLEKEFKQIFRNRFMPRLLLFMPFMMLGVLPFAANQEVKEVRVAIVDKDHSTYSHRLIEKVRGSEYFLLSDAPATYEEALQSVERGETDVILELPHDLEKRIVTEDSSTVSLSANAVNGTKGLLGTTYLTSILQDYATELRAEQGTGTTRGGYSPVPTLSLSPQYRFNPHLDYKTFMIPGLMVMVLTMLTGFLPALNIVGEKEVGTIEQMNVSPVRPWVFILGKLIPYWVIGVGVLVLAMTLAALIYGLVPVGSLVTILAFAVLYILLMSSVGIVVSNVAGTMQQAMFVMYFFLMIFFLMSGLFTPISSMPDWAQAITYANPLRYFVEAMRSIYLKGSALSELLPNLLPLLGFVLVFSSGAVLTYRKSN